MLRDNDGKPHFTVNNHDAVLKVMEEDLCSICGAKHFRGRWFVGGPLSAFHEQGWYLDPPLHKECMEYALQVCPYLSAPRWLGLIEDRTIDYDRVPDTLVTIDNSMIPDRPPLFVCVMATKQETVEISPVTRYVRPIRETIVSVEYWQHSKKLDPVEGKRLAMEVVDRPLPPRNPAKLKIGPKGLQAIEDRN